MNSCGRAWRRGAVSAWKFEERGRILGQKSDPAGAHGTRFTPRADAHEFDARDSADSRRYRNAQARARTRRADDDDQGIASSRQERFANGRRRCCACKRAACRRPKRKLALAEAVNRVLSVAVIHEFLSVQDSRAINIREVAQRIAQQMQSSLLEPGHSIPFTLAGPNIYLPARQATSCALVINELLQNALEHGFDLREFIDTDKPVSGTIELTFEDHGDAVRLDRAR